jgi:hypothetical protein
MPGPSVALIYGRLPLRRNAEILMRTLVPTLDFDKSGGFVKLYCA